MHTLKHVQSHSPEFFLYFKGPVLLSGSILPFLYAYIITLGITVSVFNDLPFRRSTLYLSITHTSRLERGPLEIS